MGNTPIWPPINEYFFAKNSSFGALSQDKWVTLHEHKVVGFGASRIALAWRFDSYILYIPSHLRAIRVLRNGAQIGYWDHGGRKVMAQEWDRTGTISNQYLSYGDTLTYQGFADAGSSSLRTVTKFSAHVHSI